MTVLLCPLCSLPRFNNLDSLRFSLIKAATQNISCPICSDVLVGLDKFTIHLFGHTISQSSDQLVELNATSCDFGWPKDSDGIKSNACLSATDRTCRTKSTENAVDWNHVRDENSGSCTINMEDLSFLTSLENSPKTTGSGNEPVETPESKDSGTDEEDVDNSKENSVQLSEYMSDLLNKKLPMVNFVSFAPVDSPAKDKPQDEQPEADSSGDKQFKCSACDFAFQNSIVLSIHQELIHSKRKSNLGKESVRDLNENPNFTESKSSETNGGPDQLSLKDFVLPRYDCHLCSKSFKMKGSLLVHYRMAHIGPTDSIGPSPTSGCQDGTEENNFTCSICCKSFQKEQHLTQHIKTHEGKRWQCETCSKYFTTKYFLKKHQRLHTGEMPYSCQTCNKTFTFQQSYHKHLLYHSDEKPHQCSQCGRAFKELSTLHNHQRIHSGEKPFVCEVCGKCFRQRVSYIVHQRIHTGVLPYQCPACKRKFRYKVSQRSHKCPSQPLGTSRDQSEIIQSSPQKNNS